jgi:hypothetical protein
MYTIDRKRLIVVKLRSSADLVPRKHIGLFSKQMSAMAFLEAIRHHADRLH